jgi:hypothetical protein
MKLEKRPRNKVAIQKKLESARKKGKAVAKLTVKDVEKWENLGWVDAFESRCVAAVYILNNPKSDYAILDQAWRATKLPTPSYL